MHGEKPKQEKLYTLHEATVEIRRRQCVNQGHDYVVTSTHGLSDDQPLKVHCATCGKSWSVLLAEES